MIREGRFCGFEPNKSGKDIDEGIDERDVLYAQVGPCFWDRQKLFQSSSADARVIFHARSSRYFL